VDNIYESAKSVKFFVFLSKHYAMKIFGLCSEKDNLNVNVQDQVISQIIFKGLALGTLIFLCKLHSQVENFVLFSVVVQPLKISQMSPTHSLSDVALSECNTLQNFYIASEKVVD
jgi:hypothetical protein